MRDLDVALEAVRAGGRVVGASRPTGGPEFKGAVNPVTEVDRAAEEAIHSVLAARRPDDAVLAEEGGGSAWNRGRVWIVDPLDGTVNFLHGIPQVAVSVALWEDGTAHAGAVLDVFRDEVFTASAGRGATLDGDPIAVSATGELGDSLIATGFPYDRRERADVYAAVLSRVLSRARGIRRIGSAALDLCWVACGRFDGFWEFGLAPWDTAAAALIVAEAGGRLSTGAGDEWDPDAWELVASNGRIHDALAGAVRG